MTTEVKPKRRRRTQQQIAEDRQRVEMNALLEAAVIVAGARLRRDLDDPRAPTYVKVRAARALRQARKRGVKV